MIKSMTGYGKGSVRCTDCVITVEVKTLNHRFCDVGIKAPRHLLFLESEIKKRLGKSLVRGKVDVFINQEAAGGGDSAARWNRDLAKRYLEIFRQMKMEMGLEGDISVSLLAAQKDVITVDQVEASRETLSRVTLGALEEAVAGVQVMRALEGEAIQDDLCCRLETLAAHLALIEGRAPTVPLEWQEKFLGRIATLQRNNLPDPQRIAQEVAIFADRCDISEELLRVKSHLLQFKNLFTEEATGRQMDFLVQELFRETNTIGSKGNDSLLSEKVVAVKAELEKIREQIQNVV